MVDGRLKRDLLRDKVAAGLMYRHGFHPVDCHRVKSDNLEHNDNFVDTNMEVKPYYIINGHKTKQHGVKTLNVISCGCAHDHDENNLNCEYGLFHKLVEDLGPERCKQGLFHCTNKRGYQWSDRGQQKSETIGKSM